ncbi:MAG: hypothetical protein AAFV95_00905 [Bacteroidota bacterium]
MKKSINCLFVLFAFLLVFSTCHKSDDPEVVIISGEHSFQSVFFSQQWGDPRYHSSDVPPHLGHKKHDNILVLARHKAFDQDRGFYTETAHAYHRGNDDIDHFRIEDVECFLYGNYANYNFSNDWDTFILNGQVMERLKAEDFREIPFSLGINHRIVYEGHFPELIPLTKASQQMEQPNVSLTTGVQLKWQMSGKPSTCVYLSIHHRSTNGSEMERPIFLTLTDDGSYHIKPELLASFQVGDRLDISLIRDAFVEESNTLIRAVEQQYWDDILIHR